METNGNRGKKGVEKIIEDLALRVLNEMDLELVGIEYKPYKGKVHLVVYIDKPWSIY